jgi:hypothetical protein
MLEPASDMLSLADSSAERRLCVDSYVRQLRHSSMVVALVVVVVTYEVFAAAVEYQNAY